ncbi:MAG TPA: ComF family protein [Candidatus Baltobacteraceae bacterium]|nr:ComF family protein [Candidatus Baltobacteraceae bacterium]
MILRNALDSLAAVLFPAPCRICARTLANASRIPVCEACLEGFERIAEPMCVGCGRPFESEVALEAIEPKCRLCRAGFYAFDRARSFARYDDALSEAIVLLKYEEVGRLGDWFAERLAEIVARAPADWTADVVVPVPLHRERRRERGYNQAELIARPLARRLKLKLDKRVLVRTKPRPARLVLSRTEHWKSVRGAYAIREGARVDKLRVLLVDDVLTTGATLDACARALKKAGAAAVLGLTVARVRSWAVAPGAATQAGSSRGRSKPDSSSEHL